MLSIREKISFGVLLALFIVPEIICGAIRSNLFMLYCYNVLHKGSNVCLPNNGAVNGLTCFAIPHYGCFALVGNTYTCNVLCTDIGIF